MGFRDRVMGWLDRGEGPPPPQTTDLVELELPRLFEGPMLLAVLERAGIDAHGVEARSAGSEFTTVDRMRILVRYQDAARAAEVLAEHRRRLRDSP